MRKERQINCKIIHLWSSKFKERKLSESITKQNRFSQLLTGERGNTMKPVYNNNTVVPAKFLFTQCNLNLRMAIITFLFTTIIFSSTYYQTSFFFWKTTSHQNDNGVCLHIQVLTLLLFWPFCCRGIREGWGIRLLQVQSPSLYM